MRLHFSIGCCDCRGTTRLRQGIHFRRIQVLFVDHMHRRQSRQQILVPQVQELMAKAGTNLPKVRRMLLYSSPLIVRCFEPASTLLQGRIALAIPSLPETDPQILEHWCYADEDHLSNVIPSEGFWSRMSAWRNTAFVNWTHRIGFRVSELFRKIDEDFGGSISWNTQPNCRVIFRKATALLSPFFLNLSLGCSSTWRCA